jgi:hypothetical protein
MQYSKNHEERLQKAFPFANGCKRFYLIINGNYILLGTKGNEEVKSLKVG